uniref:Immunoglobulin domain-containing protein n=1 Tax=Pundamilia nyererei TaxID=303518 RepID=A0A3B4FYH6_9CICH
MDSNLFDLRVGLGEALHIYPPQLSTAVSGHMTAHVGANIKLTCPRRSMGTLFWIKLVSGNFPKIFGRSFSSQRVDQRIRTATEDGIFDLYITKVQESDTGVYFCVKTLSRDLIFLKGTFLKVEGNFLSFFVLRALIPLATCSQNPLRFYPRMTSHFQSL